MAVVVMVRNHAMASSQGQPNEPPDQNHRDSSDHSPRTTRGPVLPPLRPEIDLERYEALVGVDIRGYDKELITSALEAAKRLWCGTHDNSAYADRDAVRSIARYLAREAVRIGEFNYKTAFRRANVDPYVNLLTTRQTSRSVRTIQSQLHEVGRLVHPREYPGQQKLAAPHCKRIPAASPEEVRDLYFLAPTLPAALSQRLLMVLDLCCGAGARAPDFKMLTGNSITQTSWDGDPVAVVRLPNRAGGSRLVPVADPEASERLLNLARQRKSGFLMLAPNGEVERNACNRVGEHLRQLKHRSINAAALRNRWLLDMATQAPAALMMQLCDVTTAQILSDQRDQLPTYALQHSIALLKETRP
ncbi:hypothetical protein [Mycobacterium antarcticum]|uniref:hypothetical protein n=1 Tax=Mycolicibacterium sp. TUM20984 TaxID=3023368 RepID=UPI0024E05E0F|nr:hypothetical protein [Mycolicibacterium sp. TUM20984]